MFWFTSFECSFSVIPFVVTITSWMEWVFVCCLLWRKASILFSSSFILQKSQPFSKKILNLADFFSIFELMESISLSEHASYKVHCIRFLLHHHVGINLRWGRCRCIILKAKILCAKIRFSNDFRNSRCHFSSDFYIFLRLFSNEIRNSVHLKISLHKFQPQVVQRLGAINTPFSILALPYIK